MDRAGQINNIASHVGIRRAIGVRRNLPITKNLTQTGKGSGRSVVLIEIGVSVTGYTVAVGKNKVSIAKVNPCRIGNVSLFRSDHRSRRPRPGSVPVCDHTDHIFERVVVHVSGHMDFSVAGDS